MNAPFSPSEVRQLTNLLKDFDPKRLTDEVISIGEAWADENAAAGALEESKKSFHARLTLEYLEGRMQSGALGEKPKAMPIGQAELKALADPRYEAHLENMIRARREANRLRVRYDMGRMRLELMRSLQATTRNEMRMASGM